MTYLYLFAFLEALEKENGMNSSNQQMIDRMLKKANEAFIMAIELYNRPSIKYRVEGFSFFICNAWELMIKAQIVKQFGYEKLFYYNKRGIQRTITLRKALSIVLTNSHDPATQNLKRIIELRNTSTHYIVEEDEQLYLGLFQACITNYESYMQKWHNINTSDFLPSNFLMLRINATHFNDEQIKAKYPSDIALSLINRRSDIRHDQEIQNNEKYSYLIKTEISITKNPKNADTTVSLVPEHEANEAIAIVKEYRDPKTTHPYAASEVSKKIDTQLKINGVQLMVNGNKKDKFTNNDLFDLTTFYGMRDNETYCYIHVVGNNTSRTYSEKVITELVNILTKSPGAIGDIRALKGKRTTKGAKEF